MPVLIHQKSPKSSFKLNATLIIVISDSLVFEFYRGCVISLQILEPPPLKFKRRMENFGVKSPMTFIYYDYQLML